MYCLDRWWSSLHGQPVIYNDSVDTRIYFIYVQKKKIIFFRKLQIRCTHLIENCIHKIELINEVY